MSIVWLASSYLLNQKKKKAVFIKNIGKDEKKENPGERLKEAKLPTFINGFAV